MEHFTYDYLEETFQTKQGTGAGTLTIDGVAVTKTVHLRSSNSGKSKSWDVCFTFRDATGQVQHLEKVGRFAANRRNDPERNWGLPE